MNLIFLVIVYFCIVLSLSVLFYYFLCFLSLFVLFYYFLFCFIPSCVVSYTLYIVSDVTVKFGSRNSGEKKNRIMGVPLHVACYADISVLLFGAETRNANTLSYSINCKAIKLLISRALK